jgi:N6-adenosine-specific RNA methylase IME4
MAERMMPGARRADVFSRELREGWEAFGDELAKFSEAAA